MGDFEAAVSSAFKRKGSPPPLEDPRPAPLDGPPIEPFENDFHGPPPPPPPPPQPRSPKKKKRREGLVERDGIVKKRAPRPPKEDLILAGTPKERQEVYDRIMRYVDSFPEHNFPETTMISPTTPLPDLQFVLQRIQQRINAKQELQVLQSGLVTSCMALEFGSTLIPGNPVRLSGFGANVATNINMFDDCLRQMACKYGGKMVISIEAQLGMMLLRVAANTHMTNLKSEPPPPPPPLEEDVKIPIPEVKEHDGTPVTSGGNEVGVEAVGPVPEPLR